MVLELNDENLSSAIDLCASVAHYHVLIYTDNKAEVANRVFDAINNKAISIVHPQLYAKPQLRTLFTNNSIITIVSASDNIRYLRGNLILYAPEIYSEELYDNLRARERPYEYWSGMKCGIK